MKSMILYSTTGQRSLDYSPVGCKDDRGKIYLAWIRAEVVEADPAFALDMAEPRANETVLNTIPLP